MSGNTTHFQKCFTNELEQSIILPAKHTFEPVSVEEFEDLRPRLKNKRAPGLDDITAEDLVAEELTAEAKSWIVKL